MLHERFKGVMRFRARTVSIALILFAGGWLSLPLAAQQQGPLPPPPPPANPPARAPEATLPSNPPAPKPMSSSISKEPPSIPVDQIIQRFAQREAEFKTERDNFTYEQTFVIQTLDDAGRPDGEYRMTSDIVFTPSGKRYEKVTYAPPPTLERVTLSEQDLDDLRNVQPFVLTTAELPKYNLTYVGREQVDEISAYVFDVTPKTLEKNQRYFQGRIWVDDKDLEIVKTYGKAVPDIHKGSSENMFPRFETYRENIEGHYWFPTYTHADDILYFRSGAIHLRMTVRYSNYKRFGVTIRIGTPIENKQPNP
jgi:hypothetical protein